jgi:N6-adenosine-specific RNA methylase IME4
MTAPPTNPGVSEAYGKLKEDFHITGYTFERACISLEWLLENGRWQLCADFADVNEFLDGIRLDKFKALADERKRLAAKIKALQPKASNRQIAKTLGVSKDTVRGDLGGEKSPRQSKKAIKNKGVNGGSGENSPHSLPGDEAARVVARAERVKNQQQSVSERTAKVSLDARKLGKFSVILADPPWDDEFGASNRSIENHYPTMKFADILALPVGEIAHAAAMLFLWATPSMLEMALATAKAWGFEYRTQMVWVKPSIGLGKYVRQRHEILLICRRGDHPAPLAESLPESVIEAPRAEHSAKPAIFHDIIERMYPEAERVELFSRGKRRKGWKIWGAEAQMKEAAAEHYSKLIRRRPIRTGPSFRPA